MYGVFICLQWEAGSVYRPGGDAPVTNLTALHEMGHQVRR